MRGKKGELDRIQERWGLGFATGYARRTRNSEIGLNEGDLVLKKRENNNTRRSRKNIFTFKMGAHLKGSPSERSAPGAQ